jgi:hypothetical protein
LKANQATLTVIWATLFSSQLLEKLKQDRISRSTSWLSHPKRVVYLDQQTPIKEAFDKEIYIYNTVLPAFRKFQKERNNITDNSSYIFAWCFFLFSIEKKSGRFEEKYGKTQSSKLK